MDLTLKRLSKPCCFRLRNQLLKDLEDFWCATIRLGSSEDAADGEDEKADLTQEASLFTQAQIRDKLTELTDEV